MKKLFTILALAPMIVWGQSGVAPLKKVKAFTPQTDVAFPNPQPKQYNSNKTNGSAYGSITIGRSEYDLQSNAAVARRIIVHPGNKMSIVWTTASDASAWPSRGTGYNHYNGTTWVVSDLDLTKNRIENERVGWPSIGVIDEGGAQEYVLAHAVSSTGQAGGFVFSKNGSVGNTSFSGTKVLDDTYDASKYPGPIWGRAVTHKNKIFIIANHTDSSSAQPFNYKKDGVRSPTVYSIYDAVSKTWTTKNAMLPGFDSVRYVRGNGDEYSIDANDNVVAIVMGGYGNDLALWKSTDEGQSWTKTIIDSFPPAMPIPSNVGMLANNGSVNVIVDKDNVCHVFYPILGQIYDSITNTDTQSYVRYGPSINGIIHWADKIDPNTNTYDTARIIAQAIDVDNDGLLTYQANARKSEFGGYGQFLQFVQGASTLTVGAVTTQPCASIDDSGIIYVTYVALVEGDENSGDEENFRDIYVVYSRDNGKTWSTPQNVTNTPGTEEAYASMPRFADGKLRITYQEKSDPGSFVTNTTNNPSQTCDMKYLELDINKIKGGTVGISAMENNFFAVGQNQPNPFNGNTTINLEVKKAGKMNFTVTNLIGKQVYSSSNNLGAGRQSIEFNASSLASGIYVYTVEMNGVSVSRRMIVK